MTVSLTELLKNNIPFDWSEDASDAFNSLNVHFTSAPIFQHFTPSKPIIVETDASDFAIAGVLSQHDSTNKLHPEAFSSRKLTDAEVNWVIYDKEMLAIIVSFEDLAALLIRE